MPAVRKAGASDGTRTFNPLVQRQAQELISRTLMLVKRYETTAGSACGCEEHRAIFRALAARERGKAVKAMTTHLSLVETRLRPTLCEPVGPSLDDVLAEEIAARGATDPALAAAE